jgi:cytochrome c5
MKLALYMTFICMAALCGCPADTGINAAELLESRCGVCHSSDIPKNARKSKSAWDECVTRMIAKGAKLSPAEKKSLVRHLAKQYRL